MGAILTKHIPLLRLIERRLGRSVLLPVLRGVGRRRRASARRTPDRSARAGNRPAGLRRSWHGRYLRLGGAHPFRGPIFRTRAPRRRGLAGAILSHSCPPGQDNPGKDHKHSYGRKTCQCMADSTTLARAAHGSMPGKEMARGKCWAAPNRRKSQAQEVRQLHMKKPQNKPSLAPPRWGTDPVSSCLLQCRRR